RGGDAEHVDIDSAAAKIEPPSVDMLALQDGLKALEKMNERAYQVVMLRYFAGLTVNVCAELLEIAPRTVEREWRLARAFLKDYMESD
ncbi:MAG: ECF-type sigma factor, partial [Myxococcota bacterium]